MDTEHFLKQLREQDFFKNQIAHIESLPSRPALFGTVDGGLDKRIETALESQGIKSLYVHQADAINKINTGKNVVIVTGTASGKTLCYTIPVLDKLLQDPRSTMLFLFPTKALAQDQLRGLTKFQDKKFEIPFMAGTYDGDTPGTLRRKLRDGANIILTNPDMLHQGILPQHARWNRFFTHLKYIVIDEVHTYRGIFGSHLTNVVRRLHRICQHYGSNPQFICCSATIANPAQHASNLCGREVDLVSNDGSPRGAKKFVLWNPPPLETAALGNPNNWRVGGDRKSSLWEAVQLMTALVKERIQTIAFVRTRLASELIFKHVREQLRPYSRKLSEAVHAYRGGYLPQERREIESRLANKEILGVSSTNALELGIDIGSLDACIMVGYPGTIASMWQQSGRAGRSHEESLVFLVGQNSPIDQYLMIHAPYLFNQTPEYAVVDPDNPHIVVGHLKCAAQELPLESSESDSFGIYGDSIAEILEEDALVKKIETKYYWASSEYPSADVNLRNFGGPVYTIQDSSQGEKVIGTMDELSALTQLHNHAVYLHGAETYFVNELDINQKIAHVEKKELDYYTQSIQSSQIKVDSTDEQMEWNESIIGFGDVTVTTTIPMFKKIKFHSRDSLGYEKLELPPQSLETVAMWFAPANEIVNEMALNKMLISEALIGVANVLIDVIPLFIMCDAQDIGTVVDSSCLKREALFVHDRYPGGMGYAKRCRDSFGDLCDAIYNVVVNCGCEDGCPSCVGSAIPPSAMTDLDSGVRGRIPNKEGTLFLLRAILEKSNKKLVSIS